MDYKYNELEYARLIYNKGFQSKHIPTELRLLALYYRDVLGLKPKDRKNKLYEFCEKHIPNYNRARHFKMIEKSLKQANNKTSKLITINQVDMYEDEVDFINSLNLSDNHKKVLFSLLVHKKLSKIVYDIRNSNIEDKKEYNMMFFKGNNKAYNDIKKISNISSTIKINDEIIYDLSNYILFEKGKDDKPEYLIKVLHKGLIVLNYIQECNENGNVVITIKDFDNVGLYLDYYNGVDKVLLCKHCNQPFKQTKNNILYCNKHQGYQPISTKTIQCIDCGKEIEVDSKDNKTERCEECYKIYRTEYYRINKQKQREKSKMSTEQF